MAHWTDRFVGPNDPQTDCGDLVQRVLREQFGREVALPSERWYAGAAGRERLRLMAAQLREAVPALAVPTEQPAEGDLVLMHSGAAVMHAGVYCAIGGEGWVLHAAERLRAVILTRVRELEVKGYRLEGYYRWT